jgi:V/A-type H+-transporting ATPase subunit E
MISNLAKRILEEASNEADKILNAAEIEARKILEEAKERAETILNEALKEAERRARENANTLIADAGRRLWELKREVLRVAYEIAAESFELAAKKLPQITEREDYVNILSRLILEAIGYLRETDLKVAVNRRDIELVRKLLPNLENDVVRILGKKVRLTLLEDPIDVVGGAVVMTADGSVIYNNSLEARLESAQEKLMPDIIRKLVPEVIAR